MNKFVFIRADANESIGFGHLSRCIILGQELKLFNFKIIFLLYQTDTFFIKELEKRAFEYILLKKDEPEQIISIIKQTNSLDSTLIFDTDVEIYYNTNSQLNFINHRIKLVFFTFWKDFKYLAHLIINQNPIGLTHHYQTAEYTKRLLGPSFMIFDDQFIRFSKHKSVRHQPGELVFFISFGGSDQADRTQKTIDAIQMLNLNIKRINIVIGAIYPYEERLFQCVSKLKCEYKVYKQTNKIAEIMNDSNIAICAGGLTLWELAIFNIPTAILSDSKREEITGEYLHNKGLGYFLGSINHLNMEELSQKIVRFVEDKEAKIRMSILNKMIDVRGKKIIAREINNLNLDDK